MSASTLENNTFMSAVIPMLLFVMSSTHGRRNEVGTEKHREVRLQVVSLALIDLEMLMLIYSKCCSRDSGSLSNAT